MELNDNLQNSVVVETEEEISDEELSKLFVRVELDETESEHLSVAPYSYWKSVFRVFIHKPSAVIGLVTLFILILGCIFIPLFAKATDFESNVNLMNLDPSWEHWFGTDITGRDLWFTCWKATGISLLLALINTLIVTAVGTVIGFIWGYFRKIDRVFIELYNLISNVPSMLIYMLISFVFVHQFPNLTPEFRLCVSLCIFGWLGMSLLIRNQVLIITEREYNVASITLGTPAHRIITRNLLPYVLAVIVTDVALTIPGMISSEVALSYFSLGLPKNSVSLGAVLTLGIEKFGVHNNQFLFPALMLGIVIFAFFLIGTALSDALDPKTHR